jgi:hypothetical protein
MPPRQRPDAPPPTGEQQAILDHAERHPGGGRKVAAAAGSGKTTTLEMLAARRRDPAVYVAFNRAIKLEAARRFPPWVKVTTAHAAAYGALQVHDQQHRLGKRLFGADVPSMVRLPRCRLPADALGQVVVDSVARFCNSADAELSVAHVALDPREPEDIRLAALSGAQALWRRMADRDDDCPITHDTYLKLWQLGAARLGGFDWALFDEAQDASPVMIDVMRRQGFPVTWVGDSHQAIYQFRGAVNAMRLIALPEFTLSQSFRFGQRIADCANAVLAAKPDGTRPTFAIVGNPRRDSGVGRLPKGARHAFLSRTNAEWFDEALRWEGRVHVIGGIDDTERLLLGAWGLWRHGQRPERCPAVARFSTWAQLCEHAERFDDRELAFARRVVEQWRERLPAAIADLRARHVEHEADASLILSTAHKAKGREFPYVRLGGGFPAPSDEEWARMPPDVREAELNLLYVALTRAVDGLEPNQAVCDCLALRARSAPTPPSRLPLLVVAAAESPPPAAALALAPDPALLEAALAAGAPPPSPAKAARRKKAKPPAAAPGGPPRLWSAEEDAELARLAHDGADLPSMAELLGRRPETVSVRLAVIGAPGADFDLVADVAAALVPPRRDAPPPEGPTPEGADDPPQAAAPPPAARPWPSGMGLTVPKRPAGG